MSISAVDRLRLTIMYLNQKFNEGKELLTFDAQEDVIDVNQMMFEVAAFSGQVKLTNHHIITGAITRLAHVSFEDGLKTSTENSSYTATGYVDNGDTTFTSVSFYIPSEWVQKADELTELLIEEYEQGTFHPAWVTLEDGE